MRKLIVSAVKREKSQPLRNCVASDPPLPSEFPCPCPPWGGVGVTILPCDAGHQHKTR